MVNSRSKKPKKPQMLIKWTEEPKKILKKRPKASRDWLGVTPGDIIYYHGAFGFKVAIHWGLYVGNGYVLEKWRDLKDPKKGDIVLSPLSLFGTEQNFVLSWDRKKFIKAVMLYRKKFDNFLRKEKNFYRSIYIASNPRVGFSELMDNLPRVGEKSSYSLLTQNCSHFITEVGKGEKKIGAISSFFQVFDIILQKKDPRKLREFCLKSLRFY